MADDETPGGALHVGSLETTTALRLPPILVAYAQAHPNVALHLQTGPTATLIDKVLQRKIDCAFVSGPIVHTDLVAVPVVQEELVLVTAPSLTEWQDVDRVLSATDKPSVIVFRDGCSYRQRAEEFLAHRGFVDVPLMEMGTLDGIIGCVGAGIGVMLLPRAVAEPARVAGRVGVHKLPSKIGLTTTMFIRRHDAFLSAALRRFLEVATGGDQRRA